MKCPFILNLYLLSTFYLLYVNYILIVFLGFYFENNYQNKKNLIKVKKTLNVFYIQLLTSIWKLAILISSGKVILLFNIAKFFVIFIKLDSWNFIFAKGVFSYFFKTRSISFNINRKFIIYNFQVIILLLFTYYRYRQIQQ